MITIRTYNYIDYIRDTLFITDDEAAAISQSYSIEMNVAPDKFVQKDYDEIFVRFLEICVTRDPLIANFEFENDKRKPYHGFSSEHIIRLGFESDAELLAFVLKTSNEINYEIA